MISAKCLRNSSAVCRGCFVFSSTRIRRAKCSISAKSTILFFRFAVSIARVYSSASLTSSSRNGHKRFCCKSSVSRSIAKYFFCSVSTSFFTSDRISMTVSFFLTSPENLRIGDNFPKTRPFKNVCTCRYPCRFSACCSCVRSASSVFAYACGPSGSLHNCNACVICVHMSHNKSLACSAMSSSISVCTSSCACST